ncbi:MAG TPA: phosphoglycerate dehydrogenase [Streptosporangiaceae bacterium]
MPRPIVLVAEELSPAGIALLDATFEVRYADGSDRAQLLPALADADAVIVRSATDIDAEAIAAAPRLQVVARAGVGLDNIDVEAATKAGIMVVNAPTSNIVSAAEHAVALLLAVARHVPQAMASLRRGEWKRAAFTGVELHGKVAGILGLGKVGVLVAERLAAFGMTVVAYDPYVAAARASELGVRLAGLSELLAEADFISIHLPRTADTIGLLGDRELHLVKPEVRIVNAARGGIVDEAALARALSSGRVAAAALDVYAREPCTDSPLFGFDNVVVTPHLGASTTEAQEKAGTDVARSVRLALAGEFVPDAVNVQGGAVAEEIRPGLPLAEQLGRIFTALAAGVAARVQVEVLGDIAAHDVRVLQLAAMKGIFLDSVAEQVTYVNAPLIARERGVAVSLSTALECPDWRNLIRLRGTLPGGQVISVSGTLTGLRQAAKIVEINGFATELAPADHMMFLSYTDRPGVVGVVGQILGDREINIAGMQVCRDARGGEALIALTVDSAVPADAREKIIAAIGATVARVVDLSTD